MAIDPSVLAVLRNALEADPENLALRLHLAQVLVDDRQTAEAFTLAEEVLARQPDDVEALAIAVRAGQAEGYDRADAYERLLRALTEPPGSDMTTPSPEHTSTPDATATTPPGGETPFLAAVPSTADDLISTWEDTAPLVEPEIGAIGRPGITLADVGGLQEVKERLELSFLAPLRNPDLQAQFGVSLRGGLLLWGPPGCGKTFVARAVAGELGASFYEVGLADVLDMWIGSSERNLRAVFEVARRNSPCVLFFDEVDALGMKRTQLRQGGSAMRGVVNQLLAELDGVGTDNDGVFVLAATNHPWDVDAALQRPGRFDRKLLVLPPDAEARAAIFATHLRGKPVEPVDLADLAKRTEGLSGADIALVCDQATETALADSVRTGRVRRVTQKDLVRAAKQVRPSTGPWFETARNFAMFNNDGGEYDDLIAHLRRRR